MSATDPKITLRGIIDTYLVANPLKIDDGATNAFIMSVWQSGPERLKYLFFVANYDLIITFGEFSSKSVRPIQNAPLRYIMSMPVTVTAVDKLDIAGVVVCTGARMLYKATYAIRSSLEAAALSGVGATPAYMLKEDFDRGKHVLLAGLDIWSVEHTIEYIAENP